MGADAEPSKPLYADAAYYRMLFRERTHDVAFYRDFCAGAGDVLELGVGQGRVAFALAEDGARVLGVDASQSMLAALEQRRAEHPRDVQARVETRHGDARELRLGRRFARVIAPFNTLGHMHRGEDAARLFATAHAHLGPGGRLAFDTLVPDAELTRGGASSVPRFVHPSTGAVCRLEERYRYEPRTKVLTVETSLIERLSGRVERLELAIRQWSDRDVREQLDAAGFKAISASPLGDSVAWQAER